MLFSSNKLTDDTKHNHLLSKSAGSTQPLSKRAVVCRGYARGSGGGAMAPARVE